METKDTKQYRTKQAAYEAGRLSRQAKIDRLQADVAYWQKAAEAHKASADYIKAAHDQLKNVLAASQAERNALLAREQTYLNTAGK